MGYKLADGSDSDLYQLGDEFLFGELNCKLIEKSVMAKVEFKTAHATYVVSVEWANMHPMDKCDGGELKFFVVHYDGHHGGYDRGGLAVVMAKSEEEAIELVCADDETEFFDNAGAIPILHGKKVLYNDNGAAEP